MKIRHPPSPAAQPLTVPRSDLGAEAAIRPFRARDVFALYEAARESVEHVYPWLPWCHAELRRRDAAVWIAHTRGAFFAGEEFNFAIVDGAGRLLGSCGISAVDNYNGHGNVGYWVRRAAVGCGVATRATALLTRWAFANTRMHRLEILAAAGNVASRRVAEKAGFKFEARLAGRLYLHGRHHDALLYRLLRRECERNTADG